jgi:D-glycero-beta-D-manno-heptose-7-phosphate kinase
MSDERGPASPITHHSSLITRFSSLRILVLGDLVLDEYMVGRAGRLSREAPIPVLDLVERFWRPGAASNPAANVASLGGSPRLIGVLGADAAGETLRTELARAGIDGTWLVPTPTRPTATKTRILAEHVAAHRQQVARIDHVPNGPLPSDVEKRLIERITATVPEVDAVLVSDYKSGVVNPRTIEAAVGAARQAGKPIAVDSQGDLFQFRGFTLVKSNQPDAQAALGMRLENDEHFAEAGRRLRDELDAHSVVITRGADGMSIAGPDDRHTHLPAANRTEVWDVTGAGDTAIAVLTLGLAAGADVLEAAKLANVAAGLVVRRLGVATVTPEELAGAAGTDEGRTTKDKG